MYATYKKTISMERGANLAWQRKDTNMVTLPLKAAYALLLESYHDRMTNEEVRDMLKHCFCILILETYDSELALRAIDVMADLSYNRPMLQENDNLLAQLGFTSKFCSFVL